MPVLYWFRRDLRLHDLQGLLDAVASGAPVIPCYVIDENRLPGGASRWWLHHSLVALDRQLRERGNQLLILSGDPVAVLTQFIAQHNIGAIHCSRGYESQCLREESLLREACRAPGVRFRCDPGGLLYEPESVANKSGKPFRVFTPFWRHCLGHPRPLTPLPAPGEIPGPRLPSQYSIDEFGLLPSPNWALGWEQRWQPGADGAHASLGHFIEHGLQDYIRSRDVPSLDCTSHLSPHLHFGEISPRQVWHAVKDTLIMQPELELQVTKFLAELGWREFNYHLLFHFPHIISKPFQPRFERFPWLGYPQHLQSWQAGKTGYPIVDAGMRELWHTGYMHNRVRMITASFLTKHLLLPWQLGKKWFDDTLLDADPANNSGGWQWAAGSGADAAPYFRVFNPTLQSKKFDPDGQYLRRWLPELAHLPSRHLHQPELAPARVLKEAGVALGKTYPLPIVDHRRAREAALAAYASIK
jgi:deoxyribodipyrimidine photo-lyase